MAKEILIADPDKGGQEEFQRVFEAADYKLVFAENGEDALLRIKLFRPDLIIAGVGLKEKGGLELCETIKNDPEFKHIPFILLTGMFEEVPEKDRLRVGVNGVISRPLREGEIHSLVAQLLEDKEDGKIEREALEEEEGWTTLSKKKVAADEKEGFVLDGMGEDDEEIIELVEVVEEPEAKMSIDDFISSSRAEPAGDITPLESWDHVLEEEKKTGPKPFEDIFKISQAPEKVPEPKVRPGKDRETTPEEELFEKIELEEILEKVERLQPMIEKEWPKDIEPRDVGPLNIEIDKKIDETLPISTEETPDQWLDLEGFEAALKAEVKGEEEVKAEPPEEGLEPFTLEEPKEKLREEVSLELAPPADSMRLDEEFFDQLAKGELAEGKLLEEEPLREEPLGAPLPGEELIEEKLPEKEHSERPLPMNLIEEELKEEEVKFIEEVLRGDEISFVEELLEKKIGKPPEKKEEEVEIFQALETPDLIREVQPPSPLDEAVPLGIAPEVQDTGFLKAEAVPEFVQEPQALGILKETEPPRLVLDTPPPGLLKEREAPKAFLEEIHPSGRLFDRQMEEVIGKGVQEMMEGFITKVLPEMTQNILDLTVERIEKMVKEILPDLAEKAIQEEIRRLHKEDQD
jgi:CheY-like chemotaxis protein